MKHNRPRRLLSVVIISRETFQSNDNKNLDALQFFCLFFSICTNHHHRWDQTGHRFMTGCIPVAVDHFCLHLDSFMENFQPPELKYRSHQSCRKLHLAKRLFFSSCGRLQFIASTQWWKFMGNKRKSSKPLYIHLLSVPVRVKKTKNIYSFHFILTVGDKSVDISCLFLQKMVFSKDAISIGHTEGT